MHSSNSGTPQCAMFYSLRVCAPMNYENLQVKPLPTKHADPDSSPMQLFINSNTITMAHLVWHKIIAL